MENNRSIPRRASWVILLVAGCALHIFSSATGYVSFRDGITMANLAKNMYLQQSLAIDDYLDQGDMIGRSSSRGRDGRLYSKYGILQSLAGVPLFAAGHQMAEALVAMGISRTPSPVSAGFFMFSTLNAWITLVTTRALLIMLYREARDPFLAALLTACFVFATPAVTFAKIDFSQPLSALLLLLSGYLALRCTGASRTSLAWMSGAFGGLAVLTRPVDLIASVSAGLLLAWVSRSRRRILAWAIPFGALCVLQLAYNVLRFGDSMNFGYVGEKMSAPLLHGIVGNLMHPDFGILFYAPILGLSIGVMASWQRPRVTHVYAMGFIVVFVLLYAKWYWKTGLAGWSGRFMYEAIPWGILLVGWVAAESKNRTTWTWLIAATMVLGALTNALPVFGNLRLAYDLALATPNGEMNFPGNVLRVALCRQTDSFMFRVAGPWAYVAAKAMAIILIGAGLFGSARRPATSGNNAAQAA